MQPHDAERIGDHALRFVCQGCHQILLEIEPS
jgi:hypothetical protein